MPLVEGQMGPETTYTLEFQEGKLRLGMKYDGKQADAEVYISLEAIEFLKMLKGVIPGQIDDKIIDILAAALK